jgi:hypothetical protein
MPTKAASSRTPIKGVGWKKKTTIAADKYRPITKAILAALTTKPIKFKELVNRVAKAVPGFEGSVGWYTISCVRDLEVQGKVTRHARPVLYSKATRSRSAGKS